MPRPPHVLVCGHGYLGQAISRDFLAAGWQVSAVNRGSLPSSEEVSQKGRKDPPGKDPSGRSASRSPDQARTPVQPQPPTLAHFLADLSSRDSIIHLAASLAPPDFIIHCASSGRGGPDSYRAVYLDGCRHLVKAFPGVPLLFTSSTSVYAQTDGTEVTEQSPASPDRETGKILRQAEDLVLGAAGVVLRLSGIYGPGRSVILKKFLSGDATLDEDGSKHLNQIHRDDAARAVLHAAITPLPGGIYNVSDSTPVTQFDCYRALAEKFARPMPPSVPRNLNRKRGWTDKQISTAKLRGTHWAPAFPAFLDAVDGIVPTLTSQ